jgi:hypothetical protein
MRVQHALLDEVGDISLSVKDTVIFSGYSPPGSNY